MLTKRFIAIGFCFLLSTTLAPVTTSAGELHALLSNNESSAGVLEVVVGDERFLETMRRLLTMDLLVIAELQGKSTNPLVLDRADRESWAHHFDQLAGLMVGGRSMRQGGYADQEVLEELDGNERETWNHLDLALSST